MERFTRVKTRFGSITPEGSRQSRMRTSSIVSALRERTGKPESEILNELKIAGFPVNGKNNGFVVEGKNGNDIKNKYRGGSVLRKLCKHLEIRRTTNC